MTANGGPGLGSGRPCSAKLVPFGYVPPGHLLTLGFLAANGVIAALWRRKMSVSMPNLDGMEVVRPPSRTLTTGRTSVSEPVRLHRTGHVGRRMRTSCTVQTTLASPSRHGTKAGTCGEARQAIVAGSNKCPQSGLAQPRTVSIRNGTTTKPHRNNNQRGHSSDAQPRFARSSAATTRGEAAGHAMV